MKTKRSRKLIFLAIAVAIIVIVAFVIYTNWGSQGETVIAPGVKAGDEFTYSINGFFSSNDPSVTVPENFQQINTTEWFKVLVTDVSDEVVSVNTTWRFTNGTELNESSTINVDTGIPYPTNGFYPIYAANLKANDYIRPHGPDRSTINETINRQYASGTRQTNRRTISIPAYDENDPTRTWVETPTIYFDKQTGILVELRDVNVYTNPEMTLTVVWKLTDTNLWQVS
jgi:hypothetical protein